MPLHFAEQGEGTPIPIVPCEFGSTKGTCLLDTGANLTRVSVTEDTQRFSVISKARTVTAHGEHITEIVEAPFFRVGAFFEKKNFPVNRTNHYEGYPHFQGVVGADMLLGRDFSFHLSERDKQGSELAPFQGNTAGLSAPGELVPKSPLLELRLQVNGKPFRAVWDTHVGQTLVSKRFIREHPTLFKKITAYQRKDIAGHEGKANLYSLAAEICLVKEICRSRSEVSDFELPDFSGEGEAPFDFIIGLDWIYSYHWHFEPSQNRFFVEMR